MRQLSATFARNLRRLAGETRGTAVIETAIVAPVLILMSVGSFEVSSMVARQHELQSGASEAEAVALAANMGAETNADELKTMLEDSLHLSDDQVTVTIMFRCNTDSSLVTSADTCTGGNSGQGADEEHGNDEDTVVSRYVRLRLQDSYTPTWSKIGIGKAIRYSVTRTVQLS